jgi:hypothetical protein
MQQRMFVVVGTQRSGTSPVRQVLDSHSAVLCRGELFGSAYGKTDGYRRFRFANGWRQLGHFLWRERQVAGFLRDRLQAPHAVHAVGFKLMRSQVRYVPYRYPMLLSWIRERHVRLIHVTRHNVLRLAASRRAAQAYSALHSRSEGGAVRFHLPAGTLVQELEEMQRDNQFWESFGAELPYLKIEYEDFVDRPELEARRMFEFLEVEPMVSRRALPERHPRIPLQEMLANYDEVRRALAGTHWEALLDG